MNFYVHSHAKEDLLNINLLLWYLTGGSEKNNEVPCAITRSELMFEPSIFWM